MKAGRLMLARLRELSRQRADFAFETTLSGRRHANLLDSMRADGYRVYLIYIWLMTPELALQRVAERVRQGGHDVPESDVRRRYRRSIANLFELYLPLADTWIILDNSATLVEVARGRRTRPSHIFDHPKYDEIRKASKNK